MNKYLIQYHSNGFYHSELIEGFSNLIDAYNNFMKHNEEESKTIISITLIPSKL